MSFKSQETTRIVDGQMIFFRLWRPEQEARAALIIIPGFNAHSAYYDWVAERFVADGLAVYAIDCVVGVNRRESASSLNNSKIMWQMSKRSRQSWTQGTPVSL